MVILTTVLLATAGSAHAQRDVASILAEQRVRALEPSPAGNFTLPSLGGNDVALADARGRWVLLTFFATWCGPCRTEMPSLERLYQARADRGLDVLGVAIDGTKRAVQRFARDAGVTFPVLLDSGPVASQYHASSVPISYIIDPRGHIVGVARGARDWAAMTGMFDALLDATPPDPDAEGVYADAPMKLPSTLVPPSAEVTVSSAEPRPGQPFAVDVRITWAGHFEDYLLHPPTIHLPESIRSLGTAAATRSSDGGAIVTYAIELEASTPGTYALDPVELRYTPRGEQEPVATRISGPTVKVAAASLPMALWIVAAVVLLGIGTAATFFVRSRAPQTAAPTGTDGAAALFETARRQRIDGDIAGFLSSAQQLSRVLGIEEETALTEAVERARYGGQLPPREELDKLQRRLERQLAARAPDPDEPERDAIRLANSEGDES